MWRTAGLWVKFMTPLDKIRAQLEMETTVKPKIKVVPGHLRNTKCPCGSGRKAKNCLCEDPKWP